MCKEKQYTLYSSTKDENISKNVPKKHDLGV